MDTLNGINEQLPENESSKLATTDSSAASEQPVHSETEPTDLAADEAIGSIENFSAKYAALSLSELVVSLQDLMQKPVTEIDKDEVDAIKQVFYKKLKANSEQQKRIFAEDGGNVEDFEPTPEPLEDSLKALLQTYKEQKATLIDAIEKEKEENLNKKLQILEQLKKLAESGDVGESLPIFRKLQQEWKAIGQIPQVKINELWKTYNSHMERFYDLIKINNEMRDYDFKKNLEQKVQLCETAEKLVADKDVVSSSRLLQKLHDEWREIGPVAREFREEIWNRFKAASLVINKRHQDFFAALKAQEEINLAAKTTICEKVAAIDLETLKSHKDWEQKTAEVIELQKEWKTIGFAPKKENVKIYERFRDLCDEFFRHKSEFMKGIRVELETNYEKKKELCEKAETLKDSTDWKNTTQIMVEIQKTWKTIGPVPKKYSDALWKRFVSACDYFFEQKEKIFSSKKSEEHNNLSLKKQLIERIDEFAKSENVQESVNKLKDLISEWNTIGHVPFKEKDKIFKAFRESVNKQMDALNIDSINRKLISFKDNIEKMVDGDHSNQLYREREKLLRHYDNLKNEIQTYENNIGFISAKSKKSDGIVQDLERKIVKLKEERDLIEQKIKLIDESL
jgi:hypothetical protein